MTFRITDPTISPYLEELIEKNRSTLIRAAVPDPELQAKLIQVNELISEIKLKDPGLVGAWGLGCGGSCAVQPELLDTISLGNRVNVTGLQNRGNR
jgi:hypothetical protein